MDEKMTEIESPLNGETYINRRGLLIRAAMAGGFALASPILLSTEARAQLFKQPSPDQQKQVGRQAATEVLKQYREVNDSRATFFKNMGRKLVNALPAEDRNKWDFNFHVLDSKDVNAFALPGGPMFLFTGLYELMDSEDAVAAVTGHEMTHVRKEHWAKAYKKQQERNAFAIGLSALFKGGQAVQTVAGLVANTIGQKFSRSEEDEADKLGLANLVAARYNPTGMVDLFEALEKSSGGENKNLAFLSDHPLTSERIRKTQERIDALNGNFPPKRTLRK